MERFDLTINGQRRTVTTEADRPLLMVLRNDLGLTGSKYGCGEGECGACSVLLDGQLERACTVAIGDVKGRAVTTIEGLATGGRLHPVQRAFIDAEAMQCGFCTAGMILAAAALLARDSNPSDQDIVDHMDGNICRCGTYSRILTAVRAAAIEMEGGSQ
jgi:aerobic-type carbon monoxide dehydrogenase small subunit (CoxS/CutS family)